MSNPNVFPKNVLIIPGWENSLEGHWQTLWEAEFGWKRVDQKDWDLPKRADWTKNIIATVERSKEPPILVAHSLGCIAVMHAVAEKPSLNIHAAFLVSPPDIERSDMPEAICDFRPAPTTRLHFPAMLVASQNDPYIENSQARAYAKEWNCQFIDAGQSAHIGMLAQVGTWEAGKQFFSQLLTQL